MPEFINNVPTQDDYTGALQLGPTWPVKLITFSVLSEPALVTYWKPSNAGIGTPELESFERLYVANSIGVIARGVAGAKFRSAIAGTPANVIAELIYPNDPEIEGGTVTSSIITGTGQLKAANVITGIIAANGAIVAGTGFSVVHNGAGNYSVTFTTPFPSAPVVLTTITTDPGVGTPTEIAATAVTVNGFRALMSSSGGRGDFAFNFTATAVA